MSYVESEIELHGNLLRRFYIIGSNRKHVLSFQGTQLVLLKDIKKRIDNHEVFYYEEDAIETIKRENDNYGK